MEKELIQILTSLGLTDKESKVYLAATEAGTSPVSQIAQKAGINRVTTYDILEKLKQRGVISHFTKKQIKYFTATKPETLLEEFEKRTNSLRIALPKLKKLTGDMSHPRVRYFEGLEGIKAIYTDTLTSKTEILNYSNSEEIRNAWPNYDIEYVEKRAKKQIFLKGICQNDEYGKKVHELDQKYFREMRLLDPTQFDFTNEINIYDDKVAIISFKDELIGMIIESAEIAKSQRVIFDMCWKFSKILDEVEKSKDIKTKLLQPIKSTKNLIATKEETAEDIYRKNLSLF
ncbi:MAG: helix-turn-helix domain-containing protein [Candidatus Peregrinibacteria bacterium]|nr:helix-turn-helix domain-containing protein [Candidatus Peregrinibacteria bacterium]